MCMNECMCKEEEAKEDQSLSKSLQTDFTVKQLLVLCECWVSYGGRGGALGFLTPSLSPPI